MVQTKLVAILLGPSGVGLVGLYQSATGLIGTVSGLGIGQSAVREVSEAHTSGNLGRVARTVIVLRRACWATGLLGWLMTAVLSWPLSVWTFGTPERAVPIALLGATLLLTSISAGQRALVQGARRIGDLARLQLLPTIPSVAISVSLYAWLGESGIVPVLIISGGVNVAFSWWIARRVPLVVATITWRESLRESGRFVSLGLAFAWSALMAAGVELTTRAWIVRDYGTEANGIYQSAWAISGVFAGFILQAMAADFYPRLSSMAKNNAEVNRLVNEQTEVGILLALPGILATLLFAPWAIWLLYTPKFMTASELLPWFVVGVFAKVVSWPLAFIQQAKGASRMFAATETMSWALLLVLTWLGLYWWQVPGVAIAFAILQGMYVLGMRYVAGRLSGFRWSSPVRRLLLLSAASVSVTLAIATQLTPLMASASGGLLVLMASGLCLLRLKARLGPTHELSVFIARFYNSRLSRRS
jgi:antigen flippase